MKIIILKLQTAGLLLLSSILYIISCTPIDYHYKDYLENSEKIYPGRVDSITFKPGYNRAAIRAYIGTDARVVKMRVSWGIDQFYESEIKPNEITGYKEIIIPEIEEGVYTFEIRTFDKTGNQSMRAEIFGQVYGSRFSNNLNNRILSNAIRKNDGSITLNWFEESADSTLLGTVVSYLKNDGDSARIFTKGSENETSIPLLKEGSLIKYQTLFKPSSLAIDTFYSSTIELNPVDYIQGIKTLYPRTTWTIAGFSSEEPNNQRLADKLIDNNDATFWIARFSSNPTDYPNHWITVDMKEILKVDGFVFAQKNGDRKIREMEVLISNDNINWESLGLFGLAAIDRQQQFIDLPEPKSFRYFKIIPKAGHDTQKQPGLAEAATFYLDK